MQLADKSQAAFAQDIGWTKARLDEFIKGELGVTADAALDRADVLKTSPRLWMNFHSTYQKIAYPLTPARYCGVVGARLAAGCLTW